MTLDSFGELKLAPRDAFIHAMRGVAASVTVVTTDGAAGRHGATVSAFSSVSADPPTVLVCLRANSRIAETVLGNGAFSVNVLPQNSPEIANRFAGMHDGHVSDRFSGIDCNNAPGIAPEIDEATVFSCIIEQTVVSGSHLIVIGHVQSVREGQKAPLAYLDGSYHRVVPHPDQSTKSGAAAN